MKSYKLNANDPAGRNGVLSVLREQLAGLPKDKTFVVSVAAERRSARQNAYLWGVCYQEIVDFMKNEHQREYSAEAVHEVLKVKFIPHRVEQMGSGDVKIYRSTSNLSKAEFSDYLEQVMAWAAEFDCVISSPEWDWVEYSQPA